MVRTKNVSAAMAPPSVIGILVNPKFGGKGHLITISRLQIPNSSEGFRYGICNLEWLVLARARTNLEWQLMLACRIARLAARHEIPFSRLATTDDRHEM